MHHCSIDFRIAGIASAVPRFARIRNGRPDELNPRLFGSNANSQVSRAPKDRPRFVAVLSSASGTASDVPGLRHALVHQAIPLAADVQMVVPVEDRRHFVLDEQVVDRHRPAGPVVGETGGTVRVLAAPLEEDGRFHAASVGLA